LIPKRLRLLFSITKKVSGREISKIDGVGAHRVEALFVFYDRLGQPAPVLQDIAQLAMGIPKVRVDLERLVQLLDRLIAFSYRIKRKSQYRVDDKRQWIELLRALKLRQCLFKMSLTLKTFAEPLMRCCIVGVEFDRPFELRHRGR